jgi:hypothetical protein
MSGVALTGVCCSTSSGLAALEFPEAGRLGTGLGQYRPNGTRSNGGHSDRGARRQRGSPLLGQEAMGTVAPVRDSMHTPPPAAPQANAVLSNWQSYGKAVRDVALSP